MTITQAMTKVKVAGSGCEGVGGILVYSSRSRVFSRVFGTRSTPWLVALLLANRLACEAGYSPGLLVVVEGRWKPCGYCMGGWGIEAAKPARVDTMRCGGENPGVALFEPPRRP